MSIGGYGRSDVAHVGAGYEEGGQDAVIALLSRPRAVEKIETHSALVFLNGDDVYKIKKAVKYAFLDFSTLDARYAACLNEIRVNRRWASEIYLGVLPVTRASDGSLSLNGEGTPVEWVVHMRRFSQDDMYSVRAQRGELSLDDIARLAPVIRAGHAAADRVLTGHGSYDAMIRLLDESAGSFEQDQTTFPREDSQNLMAQCRASLEDMRPLFQRRAFGGWVRSCHGDLHLGNIVFWRGVPTPFDALEFDDAIATVDVLDDLAFLLMDIWRLGMEKAANVLLNLYLAGDASLDALTGLQALPLFLCTRAMIRARVAAMRASHFFKISPAAGDKANQEAEAAVSEARAYFALAQRFLVPRRPRLLAIGGLSGSGKSSVARELSFRLDPPPGAVLLQSDVERKAMFGLPPTAQAPQYAYEPQASEAVYRLLRKKAAAALAAGCSVIVDAVHLLPAQRDAIESTAREHGAPFTGIWLEASPKILCQRVIDRVAARTQAGEGVYSDADVKILEKQLQFGTGAIRWAPVQIGRSVAELAVDCEMLL
jgi:uncharacterized protein